MTDLRLAPHVLAELPDDADPFACPDCGRTLNGSTAGYRYCPQVVVFDQSIARKAKAGAVIACGGPAHLDPWT
jgi:hypothetical protein